MGMKRQALVFLCTGVLVQGCKLSIDFQDGVGDDDVGESDESDTDVESSTSMDDVGTTDAETGTTTDTTTDGETDTTTDGETDTTTDGEEETTDTTTDTTDTETTEGPAECATIEVEYDAIVEMNGCNEDSECKIIDGHCGVGLGGCYYAVNTSVDETELDGLAQAYSDGGCTQGVCDCPMPPASVICDSGTCVGVD
jgi:hypothetical protein